MDIIFKLLLIILMSVNIYCKIRTFTDFQIESWAKFGEISSEADEMHLKAKTGAAAKINEFIESEIKDINANFEELKHAYNSQDLFEKINKYLNNENISGKEKFEFIYILMLYREYLKEFNNAFKEFNTQFAHIKNFENLKKLLEKAEPKAADAVDKTNDKLRAMSVEQRREFLKSELSKLKENYQQPIEEALDLKPIFDKIHSTLANKSLSAQDKIHYLIALHIYKEYLDTIANFMRQAVEEVQAK